MWKNWTCFYFFEEGSQQRKTLDILKLDWITFCSWRHLPRVCTNVTERSLVKQLAGASVTAYHRMVIWACFLTLVQAGHNRIGVGCRDYCLLFILCPDPLCNKICNQYNKRSRTVTIEALVGR